MTDRGPLLDRMLERLEQDREDGDTAYFFSVGLLGEYLGKLATAAIVALLADDVDRQRYSIEYRLVRANAIGDWAEALNSTLTGSASELFPGSARDLIREFTERVGQGDWRHQCVADLVAAGDELGIELEGMGGKVALRQFFQMFATLRNKSRGHGAPTAEQCSAAAQKLEAAISSLVHNLKVFQLPWAHLHRNFSKKYKVTPLLGVPSPFDYLKRTKEVRVQDGVYLYLDNPIRVQLVFCGSSALDIHLPNGQYKKSDFELLSYITNDSKREDGTIWQTPPERLPTSETEGDSRLDALGNVFANLPPEAPHYIKRPELEAALASEIRQTERHAILSLTGPGGIGKTTLALSVLHRMAFEQPPYEVVVWLSARDIDLLESGPKPVSPRVVSKEDIAKAFANLLGPADIDDRSFSPVAYFETALQEGTIGPTLFVVDNFETVDSTTDVFEWIDAHVRPPNKVLITTRFRDFRGDFPIEVGGMSEEEAEVLIASESARLGISHLVTSQYREELLSESDGHPYVIKILLGVVAGSGRAQKPERIVANQDRVLRALFERTFSNLSPGAQRIFLLLCSWRVLVPEVALEAVSLRPENERFDVQGAIDELRRFSLVQEIVSEDDDSVFLGVPLAATLFGRQKLEISPAREAILSDRRLLMEFGPGHRDDVSHGVLPRIERLIGSIASRCSEGKETLEESLPVLEVLASRVPETYLRLSELVLEIDDTQRNLSKDYLKRFLESSPPNRREIAWRRLADLCTEDNDLVGEIHALSEIAQLPTANREVLTGLANRINERFQKLRRSGSSAMRDPQIPPLVTRLTSELERRLGELNATDLSRLAWLYLNVQNEDRAREIAHLGVERDPENTHCSRLVERLG